MFFSRIQVPSQGIDPGMLSDFLTGNAYSIHQLLWKLFPDDPGGKRDFLYRREAQKGWPWFYMISSRKPRDVPGLFSVETKPYQPTIRSGQRLSFSLRVNPVVTKRKVPGGKGGRHDVVMDAKKRIREEGEEYFGPDVIAKQGSRWLADRSEKNGFSFDPEMVCAEEYLQHRLPKPGKGRMIRFSTLDFAGILTVDDPDRFVKMLYRGIGPAKAFGCGLMLVRPV